MLDDISLEDKALSLFYANTIFMKSSSGEKMQQVIDDVELDLCNRCTSRQMTQTTLEIEREDSYCTALLFYLFHKRPVIFCDSQNHSQALNTINKGFGNIYDIRIMLCHTQEIMLRYHRMIV